MFNNFCLFSFFRIWKVSNHSAEKSWFVKKKAKASEVIHPGEKRPNITGWCLTCEWSIAHNSPKRKKRDSFYSICSTGPIEGQTKRPRDLRIFGFEIPCMASVFRDPNIRACTSISCCPIQFKRVIYRQTVGCTKFEYIAAFKCCCKHLALVEKVLRGRGIELLFYYRFHRQITANQCRFQFTAMWGWTPSSDQRRAILLGLITGWPGWGPKMVANLKKLNSPTFSYKIE